MTSASKQVGTSQFTVAGKVENKLDQFPNQHLNNCHLPGMRTNTPAVVDTVFEAVWLPGNRSMWLWLK